MDGIFSVKSDVFSFGVLVLEIISGKKNRATYNVEPQLNLLSYVSNIDDANHLPYVMFGCSMACQNISGMEFMERRQRHGIARQIDQQSRFPLRTLEVHTSWPFMCSGKSRRQARYVFGIVDVRSTSNAPRAKTSWFLHL